MPLQRHSGTWRGAHQAASDIPALDLPSHSRYSFTDPERMEGWVSQGPGCKEQLAHGCYATARGQLDSNPRPHGRWSSALTARLSCLWLFQGLASAVSAIMHSLDEPDILSQWLYNDNCTIILVITLIFIIIIIIIILLLLLLLLLICCQ